MVLVMVEKVLDACGVGYAEASTTTGAKRHSSSVVNIVANVWTAIL